MTDPFTGFVITIGVIAVPVFGIIGIAKAIIWIQDKIAERKHK